MTKKIVYVSISLSMCPFAGAIGRGTVEKRNSQMHLIGTVKGKSGGEA